MAIPADWVAEFHAFGYTGGGSLRTLKAAYLKLCRLYHPDLMQRQTADPATYTAAFQAMQHTYEKLKALIVLPTCHTAAVPEPEWDRRLAEHHRGVSEHLAKVAAFEQRKVELIERRRRLMEEVPGAAGAAAPVVSPPPSSPGPAIQDPGHAATRATTSSWLGCIPYVLNERYRSAVAFARAKRFWQQHVQPWPCNLDTVEHVEDTMAFFSRDFVREHLPAWPDGTAFQCRSCGDHGLVYVHSHSTAATCRTCHNSVSNQRRKRRQAGSP